LPILICFDFTFSASDIPHARSWVHTIATVKTTAQVRNDITTFTTVRQRQCIGYKSSKLHESNKKNLHERTKKAKIGSRVLLVGELDIHNDKIYVNCTISSLYQTAAHLHIQLLRPSNRSIAPHQTRQPPRRGQSYTNPSLNSLHPPLNNIPNDKKRHRNPHHPYPLLTVQAKIQKTNRLQQLRKEHCDPI